MTEILWIGSVFWHFDDTGYIVKPQFAGEISASSFEQSLIEGLECDGDCNVSIISDYGTQKGTKINWSHNNHASDVFVPCISINYLRLLYKTKQLLKELRINKERIAETKYIFIYSTHTPYIAVASKIKRAWY